MRRLCLISPDVDHARKVVADLKGNGIPEKHIYVLAKDGVEMDDLPDAGPESNDFLPAYARGLEFGGTAGILAGLTALVFPPSGLIVGGGLVALLGLSGAGLGAILAGIAGASFPSSRLSAFKTEIEQGKILMMVDVPKKDVKKLKLLIHRLDPEVHIEGFEPPSPLIP